MCCMMIVIRLTAGLSLAGNPSRGAHPGNHCSGNRLRPQDAFDRTVGGSLPNAGLCCSEVNLVMVLQCEAPQQNAFLQNNPLQRMCAKSMVKLVMRGILEDCTVVPRALCAPDAHQWSRGGRRVLDACRSCHSSQTQLLIVPPVVTKLAKLVGHRVQSSCCKPSDVMHLEKPADIWLELALASQFSESQVHLHRG